MGKKKKKPSLTYSKEEAQPVMLTTPFTVGKEIEMISRVRDPEINIDQAVTVQDCPDCDSKDALTVKEWTVDKKWLSPVWVQDRTLDKFALVKHRERLFRMASLTRRIEGSCSSCGASWTDEHMVKLLEETKELRYVHAH